MNTRSSLALLTGVLLVSLPTLPAAAQDDAPTMGINFWQCDWGRLGELVTLADSLVMPVAQAMVNEGTILNYGLLSHDWADEWNMVIYMSTPDTPSYLAAFEELNRRVGEQHPDAPPITDYCSIHKDNIYTVPAVTQSNQPLPTDPDNRPAVAVSMWQCNFAAMERLTQMEDSLMVPIAQELVDAGTIYAYGHMNHQWGDEWNYVNYITAPDAAAAMAANDEISRLFGERHPDMEEDPFFLESCKAHRDNIYVHRIGTMPPEQQEAGSQ